MWKTSLTFLRIAHAYRLKRQSTLALTITRVRELIRSRRRWYVCYGHCRESPKQLTLNMSTGLVIIDCGTSCITFSSCRNRGPSGKDLRQAIDCSSVFQRSNWKLKFYGVCLTGYARFIEGWTLIYSFKIKKKKVEKKRQLSTTVQFLQKLSQCCTRILQKIKRNRKYILLLSFYWKDTLFINNYHWLCAQIKEWVQAWFPVFDTLWH